MTSTDLYIPAPGDAWEHRAPESFGMDAARLAEAAAFADADETSWPRDLRAALGESLTANEGEFGTIIGPVRPRGGVNGVILRHGYIVHEWGDTARVDMTFSASKSYVATMAGLALDRGLIRDLDDFVRDYVDDGGFDGPHNSRITWRHLLQQTSEWEGTLFGKPDLVDRNRGVGGQTPDAAKGSHRDLREPGAFWEYNDVRVNRASLAILRVLRRSLSDLLKEAIMDPIGASDTWEWHGYENSYIDIDGTPIQSVSGGGHWGGGMFINTRDHARFGLLHLRRGHWGDRQLLSERWIDLATTPCPVKPTYGCMWWLNTDRALYPSAPASSFFALGARDNVVWIDPDHDLVAVVRWIAPGATDGFI
ncbi:MAG: serine hydrolase domain-containing protein, partial [Dehalococcoidia bacterium]